MKKFFPPILTAAILIAICEVLVQLNLVPAYLMSPPSEVLKTLIDEWEALGAASLDTLKSSFAGLVLSAVFGVATALVCMRFRLLYRAVIPYAVFFQTVPIVALAPLLVIWFGFGIKTVIASSWIVSFFPVLASTLTGLQSTDPQMVDLFRLYGASPWKTLFKLRLPWALPHIFSGLKIAGGLAVIGSIVGEFVAGGGLGSLIDSARTQQRIDIVFGAVLLSTLLGFLVILSVDLLRRSLSYGRSLKE